MYDVNYFIEKFEAIPEENWITQGFEYNGKCCAAGHCGYRYSETTIEGEMLYKIFFANINESVAIINDGYDNRYTQPTPKQRILAALYDIRDKELSEANVIEASKIVNEVLVF